MSAKKVAVVLALTVMLCLVLAGTARAQMNDDFAEAVVLSGVSDTTYGSLYAFTVEPGEPMPLWGPVPKTGWFAWTAPSSGPTTLDFATLLPFIDTCTLAVYQGSTLQSLSLVAEAVSWAVDSTPIPAQLTFVAVAGTTYRFQVGQVHTTPVDLHYYISWLHTADTIPPVTSASLDPLPNAAGWNRTAVTLTLTATDNEGGSGVATTEYSLTGGVDWTTYVAPLTFSGEGTNTVSYRSTDFVGNVEDPQSITIKIDKTAPVVTSSGNLGTYQPTDPITIIWAVTDSVSGVASHDWTDLLAVPAYTLGPGPHTLTGTATDYAGNQGNGSASFVVAVNAAGLGDLTDQFSTSPAIADSLRAKLDAAAQAEVKGNLTTRNNILQAYINAVKAQVGKTLTQQEADILIAEAQYWMAH